MVDVLRANFDLDQRVGNMKRPAFVQGSKFQAVSSPVVPTMPTSIRNQDIRGRLRRRNFMLSAPRAKSFKSIQQIEAAKTKAEGIKIRLGDSTLGKIKVPKRDQEGKIIKDSSGNVIFEEKPVNFGMVSKLLGESLEEKFETLGTLVNEVKADVARGGTEASRERNTLATMIAQVLRKQEDVERMTRENLEFIARSLALIGIAKDPVAAGMRGLKNDRFIDADVWNASDGAIRGPALMFLLANLQHPLTASRPLKGVGRAPIQINSIFPLIDPQGQVLDLIGKQMYRNMREALQATRDDRLRRATHEPPRFPQQQPQVQLEAEDPEGRFQLLQPQVARDFSTGDDLLGRIHQQQQAQRLQPGALVPFGQDVQATPQMSLQQLQQLINLQSGQPGFRSLGTQDEDLP